MSYTRAIAGMRVFGLNIPKAVSSVRCLELSKEAKHRVRIREWYAAHGENASLTCRHFGISRDTFYRWRRRFEEFGPGGLEDGSQRPKNGRKPTWSKELENAVLELRRLTPGLGQGQARRSPSRSGLALLHLHGWTHPETPQGQWPAG